MQTHEIRMQSIAFESDHEKTVMIAMLTMALKLQFDGVDARQLSSAIDILKKNRMAFMLSFVQVENMNIALMLVHSATRSLLGYGEIMPTKQRRPERNVKRIRSYDDGEAEDNNQAVAY